MSGYIYIYIYNTLLTTRLKHISNLYLSTVDISSVALDEKMKLFDVFLRIIHKMFINP